MSSMLQLRSEQLLEAVKSFFSPQNRSRSSYLFASLFAAYFTLKAIATRQGPRMQIQDWSKEIAIVTGGSQGIGAGVVKGLALWGTKVAILDIAEPDQTLLDFPHVKFYKTNITDRDAVAASAAVLRKELGEPTILINNVSPFPSFSLVSAWEVCLFAFEFEKEGGSDRVSLIQTCFFSCSTGWCSQWGTLLVGSGS